MKKFGYIIALGALSLATSGAAAQDKPLLGIVSISATEANNVRYIQGATKAADELGWQTNVVDAAGSADQANSAIQNFAQLKAHAIIDMVFPYSSVGAGLAAAGDAGIPVVTWGGGLGSTVAATNGSGGPMAIPVVDLMVKKMDGKGSILALTYRTGEVCRNREVVMDEIVAKNPGITVTKNEVRIPGYFEDGAQYANAWLASHPAGQENLAIWGCWDDPAIGAIGSLRAQGRDDVLVYGINGNAQALENIKNGFMTATAWQDSFTEGYNMVKMLKDIKDAGSAWQAKAAEVPAVLVTKETVDAFLKDHPEAIK
ncbi:sugar ABC transporter substrate-binding protein [Mesorhizobium sp. YC-39]|uniref:sugar ABC transporter substrate-binding protein n=1 Tax=unclassified Mesorhizobium TaxID=325217 RepID=UPI0021E91382|nr:MULTISPECIES: sugar ABC transporter substrate-binding protein [unclassified Mesorhizobium]MCV3210845.1 sugar ABC transporter substrate-binding protein [Mesorhizobium sp. YC-2]MCV3231079.1 sugar ABC transporter substrate-binding protein [Mesorhizobium sp. YC-39]